MTDTAARQDSGIPADLAERCRCSQAATLSPTYLVAVDHDWLSRWHELSDRIVSASSREGHVSNDAARHELADVLALVQEQMSDLADMQKKRAALTATAEVADGTVAVTVNAQGVLVEAVIDESFTEDYDFADLGRFITEAAQTAAREVGRRAAELLVPMTERRKQFPALSDIVEGAPDLRRLMDGVTSMGANPSDAAALAENDDDGWGNDASFPTVRR
jgi:DNA-binding protein YbaB